MGQIVMEERWVHVPEPLNDRDDLWCIHAASKEPQREASHLADLVYHGPLWTAARSVHQGERLHSVRRAR